MKNLFYLIVLTTTVSVSACLSGNKKSDKEFLIRGDYFGQTPPGDSARLVGGAYQVPEKLGPNVNIGRARYNAFVADDESYLIIPAYGMPDSYGATDYYISFRDSLDNWSQPMNMGPAINTSFSREWSASVSADGKYLFLMSDRMGSTSLGELSTESLQNFHNSHQNGSSDIYWISTSVIDELRENAKF